MNSSKGRGNSPQKLETVSVRQAAQRLGCGLKRTYDLIWSGQLAAKKVNKQWRIALSAIEKRISVRSTNAQ